ncbi:DNA alkylation repair protein [Vibrio mimicus]
MHPWNITVKTELEPLANSADALQMQAYIRNQFRFLGIKSSQRKDVLKPLFSKEQLPEIDDLPSIVRKLWSL